MKKNIKKALKAIIVLVISTILIYFTLTLNYFFRWCDYYNIYVCTDLFGKTPDDYMLSVDSEKMKEIGDYIRLSTKVFEDSINERAPDERLVADCFDEFDPLGYVAWSRMQSTVTDITCQYITISLFLGVAISISYIIITNKKLNNVCKFIVGYISILIAFPPLYMYSWTGRFWSIREMYISAVPKYFYIAYTIIFVLMFVVNYMISLKMTKELNEVISKKE